MRINRVDPEISITSIIVTAIEGDVIKTKEIVKNEFKDSEYFLTDLGVIPYSNGGWNSLYALVEKQDEEKIKKTVRASDGYDRVHRIR